MPDQSDNYLDKPVVSSSEDLLGFAEISKSLLASIQAQPNHSSLTLGLDGAWGSGKSSILSMLKNDVEQQKSEDEIGTVIVSFSPWLITNRTALISEFFGQLAIAIKEAEKRVPKNWHKIKKAAVEHFTSVTDKLNRFSDAVAVTSGAVATYDPSGWAASASLMSKTFGKLTSKFGKSEKSLETLKEELYAALAEIAESDPSFRIIVLIDDLDRLDPDDTLEILRLVKAVGDFPAITYLLAYDRLAVASAIQQRASVENGDAYLEKIIQFSFKVPPLEPFQLRNWLRREIEILAEDDTDLSTEHARNVLDVWAGRLLATPRDIKRLLFAVRAIWPRLSGKANLLDLVWLQIIAHKAAVGERDLYTWIVRYLQSLQALAIGGNVTGQDEDRKTLRSILKQLGWFEYQKDGGMSDLDFHNLDAMLAGVTTNHLSVNDDAKWTHQLQNDDLQQWRQEKRLSSPWHWRLYFAFETPEYAITDDEWGALAKAASNSANELSNAIEEVLGFRGKQRNDVADQLFNRVIHEQKNDQLQHPDRWMLAIIDEAQFLKSHSPKDRIFGFTNLFEAYFSEFAIAVFPKLEGKRRNELIEVIFGSFDNVDLGANLLRKQKHVATKSSYEKEREMFLSEKELEHAQESQLELYRQLSVESFCELTAPYDVLFAWLDSDKKGDGPKDFFTKITETDDGLLDTLEALRTVSSSAQDGVPHLPASHIKHFAEPNKILGRLAQLEKQKGSIGERARALNELWWPENELTKRKGE